MTYSTFKRMFKNNGWSGVVCAVMIVCVGAGLLATADTAGADKIEIVGNATTVSLTSFDALTANDFNITPLNDAILDDSVGPPDIIFPITGGFVDTHADLLVIEHENSGFSLEKNDQTDGRTLYFENFLVDTEKGVVFSDTTVNMTTTSLDFPLFVIGDDLALELTSEAALLLDAAYLVGDLTGEEFGIASLDLQLVPSPGAVFLLGSALVVMIGLKKRK